MAVILFYLRFSLEMQFVVVIARLQGFVRLRKRAFGNMAYDLQTSVNKILSSPNAFLHRKTFDSFHISFNYLFLTVLVRRQSADVDLVT